MKKVISTLVISTLVISFCFNVAFAQSTEEAAVSEEAVEEIIEEIALQAEAGSDKNVAVGRTVLFDASGSTGPQDHELKYAWDFGDGQSVESLDASHIYEKAGTYRVTLTLSDGEQESIDEIIVSVAEDIILLITDDSIEKKEVKQLETYAATQDVLLISLRDESSDPDYLVTQKLANKLVNKKEDIIQSNLIITWTSSQTGLNALSQFVNNITAGENQTQLEDFGFAQKGIIAISDKSFAAPARIAQSAFNALEPQYILLTEKENLTAIIDAAQVEKVINYLKNKQATYQLIGYHSQRTLTQLTPLNFLSYLMSYLVNKGVTQDTLFLILMLPVIATIVAFARQFIGLKAYGIYMPTMMALIFVVIGIKYGLAIFFALLLAATLIRLVAKRLRILYLPRMAIVLIAVSLTILAIFALGAMTNRTGLLAVSVFPILIMTILTEKFVEAQIEQGAMQALKLTIETLVLSVASYYIVTWTLFENIILAYPELIFLTIIVNLILGRFSGLRLMEYLRFRKVIKHVGNTKK